MSQGGARSVKPKRDTVRDPSSGTMKKKVKKTKKIKFTVLTKEQVEADRCTAYKYLL